jgi:hypothetical protein
MAGDKYIFYVCVYVCVCMCVCVCVCACYTFDLLVYTELSIHKVMCGPDVLVFLNRCVCVCVCIKSSFNVNLFFSKSVALVCGYACSGGVHTSLLSTPVQNNLQMSDTLFTRDDNYLVPV